MLAFAAASTAAPWAVSHRYAGQLSHGRCRAAGPGKDHQIAKQTAGADARQVVRWKPWHRRTSICCSAKTCFPVVLERRQGASSGHGRRADPGTVPELLRLLRDAVIPPHRARPGHQLHWSARPRRHQRHADKSITAGTPTPKQHHDHNELQLSQQQQAGRCPGAPQAALKTAIQVCLVAEGHRLRRP